MEDIQEFETLNADTLADFNNLPPRSQRAYFADARPLWPKNKDGIRVRPSRKSRRKTAKAPQKHTTSTQKTHNKHTKKATKRKASSKRSYSSSSFTKSQKIAFGLGGAALLTWLIIKRP